MIYTVDGEEITEKEAFDIIVSEVKENNSEEEIRNYLNGNGKLR